LAINIGNLQLNNFGLGAAMAIPDQGVNITGQQIDAGQQTDRAVTFVFMIASGAFK